MAYVITELCDRCGLCISECPTGSIVEGSPLFIIDTDTCQDHAACVAVCPTKAIAPQSEIKDKP